MRWIALDSPARLAALAHAQSVVTAMMHTWAIRPRDLRRNLLRFEYALEKFGITMRERGATGHGLRHEVLKEVCQLIAGEASPAQGGGPVAPELDRVCTRAAWSHRATAWTAARLASQPLRPSRRNSGHGAKGRLQSLRDSRRMRRSNSLACRPVWHGPPVSDRAA